jgi:hypothetical protein
MRKKSWMATRWASGEPRRYSYYAVLAAVVVGALAPTWASWVLGPVLLLGLVLLGVAHGRRQPQVAT